MAGCGEGGGGGRRGLPPPIGMSGPCAKGRKRNFPAALLVREHREEVDAEQRGAAGKSEQSADQKLERRGGGAHGRSASDGELEKKQVHRCGTSRWRAAIGAPASSTHRTSPASFASTRQIGEMSGEAVDETVGGAPGPPK